LAALTENLHLHALQITAGPAEGGPHLFSFFGETLLDCRREKKESFSGADRFLACGLFFCSGGWAIRLMALPETVRLSPPFLRVAVPASPLTSREGFGPRHHPVIEVYSPKGTPPAAGASFLLTTPPDGIPQRDRPTIPPTTAAV